MSKTHRKINARDGDVMLALPFPDAVWSRRKQLRITLLSLSCVLTTGLLVLF